MPLTVVRCRRLVVRYSLVAVALCIYTVWIHGHVPPRSPHVIADGEDDEGTVKSSRQRRAANRDDDKHGRIEIVDTSNLMITADIAEDITVTTLNSMKPVSLPTTKVDMIASTAQGIATSKMIRHDGPLTTSVRMSGTISEILQKVATAASLTPSSTSVSTSPSPMNLFQKQEQLIVHVTWFYPPRTDFRFHEAMCLLAIQRFVRPRKILFWYDAASTLPVGPWWHFARQSVAHLLPVPIDRPTSIYNKTVAVPEHQSDVARLDVLERHGGLYVDLDVIIVRPLDDLIGAAVDRKVVIMGAESPDMLGSGFILSPRPGAEFLKLWRQSYAVGFDDSDWNRQSVFVPMQLARERPDLVGIEWFLINRPNWNERRWLYAPGALWDWSSNYAVHLWYRDHPAATAYDPVTIRQLNTTTGEILRHIYYEHPDLLPAFTLSPFVADHQSTTDADDRRTTEDAS